MVIVIGAGVIGASVAYRLASAGTPVTVLDAGPIGGGTSSATFAWMNAHHKTPQNYFAANVAGMRAHRALKDELGDTPWLHQQGTIAWETDGERYQQKVALMQSWGYTAEWLRKEEVATLVPEINLAAIGDVPVAYFADDAWVDAMSYAQGLLRAAQRHGAIVLPYTPVTQLIREANRVTGVVTQDGTRYDADVVVNCTGRWSDATYLGEDLAVPLAPTAGLMVFTPPVACSLQQVIFSPRVHMRPDGGSRLLICRNDLEIPLDAINNPPATNAEVVRALLDEADKILPLLTRIPAEALRVGIRALPKDQFPVIGTVPGVDGYYAAVAHSGVTLAPFIGEVVADEIINNTQRAEVADYRPARFIAV
jgi:glycine/D-amino acid oxidase-like deaminating enzyme